MKKLKLIMLPLLMTLVYIQQGKAHKYFVEYWVIGIDYTTTSYIVTTSEVMCSGTGTYPCHILSPIRVLGTPAELPIGWEITLSNQPYL